MKQSADRQTGKIPDKQGNGVKFVEINADQAGQRIDNFLMTYLKGLPKSRIYRIVRKGEVRVNKGRVKPEYRLKAGDRVRVPPVRREVKAAPTAPDAVMHGIEQSILFEDKGLIVLNKPSGIAVHGGSGLSYGVIEALRASRPDAPYLELVHRLDRETSGCLMIAKKRSFLRHLHEQIREGQLSKHYWALVKGHWRGGKRVLKESLVKNIMRSGERLVAVDEQGKAAESVFDPIEYYPGATLMDIDLRTGRTHQIRVHAAHAGHPLAGDEKYGEPSFNKAMRELGLKRLFLHARYLVIRHPQTGETLDFTAPLDPQLEVFLDRLASA
ncbi:MAG: 23S rRNA pseudouridine(955/2504/2580) synthase RluC [Granulosicoccaceae bacterium]|jgi:23S rRNA pseudouridine955/2504/2580 synthase